MAKQKHAQGKGHSIEAINEFGGAVAQSVKDNLSGSWNDTWKQILGLSPSEGSSKKAAAIEHHTDPKTGEVVLFNRSKHKDTAQSLEKKARAEIRAAIDYHGEIVKSRERSSQKETHELDQRVEQIMSELQRLVKSSRVLQLEFAEVSVEQNPVKAGEYHLNFLEWMLIVIKNAREKVEDSGAWLATVKGKNGKKGGYWDSFKKHGTSFGLSNERAVATQTG